MPMCSGLETVLLLLRGLTGSYSHLKPRSRQRSHCGRSSLHFFFFSLLCQGKRAGRHVVMFRFDSPMYTAYHEPRDEPSAACFGEGFQTQEARTAGRLHAYLLVSAFWES